MKTPKRITALVLTAVLVISVCPVFAAGVYKDVKSGFWATNEIIKCKECKVFEGYPNGTFGPNDDITQEQLLVVLYRSLKYKNNGFDETDYTEEHDEVLDDMGVSQWAKLQLAYALKNGYVSASEFEKYKASKSAYRINIGLWTAKAMGYELSALSALPYTDTAKIDSKDFAYIDALYRHGIMNGNSDGSFGGSNFVSRAQMAAVCARVLNEKESQSRQTKAKLLAYQYGSIETVNTQRRTVLLRSGGKAVTLRISDDAVILLDGQKTDITALSLMRGISASFSSVAGAAETVIIQTKPSALKGTVESVTSFEDFVLVNLRDENNIQISLAADSSSASDLYAGRSISYISDGAQLLSWK